MHLGNVVHEHVLHSVLEGDRRARASRAGTGQLHRDGPCVRVEPLVEDVSPVFLDRWPHLNTNSQAITAREHARNQITQKPSSLD